MTSDLTFITNEAKQTLRDRFGVLIKDTRDFDVLVGYFYTSGFHSIYKSLEKTEKIRILIGIGTDKRTVDSVQNSKQSEFQYSHAEVKEHFSDEVKDELENSDDSDNAEEGVYKFIEWLRSGKLEIKAYPAENIHAESTLLIKYVSNLFPWMSAYGRTQTYRLKTVPARTIPLVKSSVEAAVINPNISDVKSQNK